VIALAPAGAPAIGITGVGGHVPARAVGNDELERRLGVPPGWIVDRSGIEERRIAAPDEAASDLALPAARLALERAGVGGTDLDLVIVATATPDMPSPATAAVLADALGARAAVAYDMSAASTGFLYGAAQAWSAIASGLARRALVVGAEVLSRITDWDDRDTALLFADGAAAAVVEEVENGGFLGFELGSDGAGASDILVPAGGSRLGATAATVAERRHTIRMNGQAVFRFSTRVTAESAGRLLDACRVSANDVDAYVPHQSNRRIIDASARRLGIPAERVVVNIDRYGNTSSASIPLALADAVEDGRLQAGSLVLLTAVGAGLTWGSSLLRWSEARAGA
jgi:3-oxoacyl-[acyl-carrier-protein] synthase-3